jgi:hypothetical protein
MPIAELDPTYEHRHIFYDPGANPHIRESLSWPIPLPQHDLGLIIYTWVHAEGTDGLGRAGASAVAYGPSLPGPIFEVVDEVGVPDEMGFDRWEVGAVKLAMPGGEVAPHLRYDGQTVSVDCTFEPLHAAFAYGPNPADAHRGSQRIGSNKEGATAARSRSVSECCKSTVWDSVTTRGECATGALPHTGSGGTSWPDQTSRST